MNPGLVRCVRCGKHGGLPIWMYDDCSELIKKGYDTETVLCVECRREIHRECLPTRLHPRQRKI